MIYIGYERKLALKQFYVKCKQKIIHFFKYVVPSEIFIIWSLFGFCILLAGILLTPHAIDFYKKQQEPDFLPLTDDSYRILDVIDLHSIDITTLKIKVELDTLNFPKVEQISLLADKIYKADGPGWESVIITFYLKGMDLDLKPYVLTEYRFGKQQLLKIDHTHSVGMFVTETK